MDELTYTYTGNQLTAVADAGIDTVGFKDGNTGTDYDYDANGNMVLDNNKEIDSIAYNHLNLPALVRKTSGDYITYVYDASGRKLTQRVFNASDSLVKETEYLGAFFYENDTLKFINHAEGRVVMEGAQPEYQYHLKDHLGNVRMTFTTKEEVESNRATLEAANLAEEQGEFLRYENARRVQATLFDHTNGSSTGYSQRLNGTANEIYGLARSISVMPGDTVRAEVFVKYVDEESGNLPTGRQAGHNRLWTSCLLLLTIREVL